MEVRDKGVDGLRGVAIILVVLFHTFYKWLPKHYEVEHIGVISSYGWLGVELFFIVSGYVIYNSLNRYDVRKFFVKRVIRLYPAFFIGVLIISLFSFMGLDRIGKNISVYDVLINLTFVSPVFVNRIFDTSFATVDGVFWSLYVELIFYLFAAGLFFLDSKRFKVYFLSITYGYFVAFCVSWYLSIGFATISGFGVVTGVYYYSWFAVGIFSFAYRAHVYKLFFWIAVCAAPGVIFVYGSHGASHSLVSAFLVVVWFLVLKFSVVTHFVGNRIFLFFGMISYPLYLLHQEIGFGLREFMGYEIDGIFVSLSVPIFLSLGVLYFERRVRALV